MRRLYLLLLLTLLGVFGYVYAQSNSATRSEAAKLALPWRRLAATQIARDYGKTPLTFEANWGQTDAKVRFLSRGHGFTLFLTDDEAVFSLRRPQQTRRPHLSGAAGNRTGFATTNETLTMRLVGTGAATKVTAAEKLPSKSNYFIGNDPKKWKSNVPNFGKIRYERVYPGIDLVYYGNQQQLEYDFVVTPGADPHRIEFDVDGADNIQIDGNGDLILQTLAGNVCWHKPRVYQKIGSRTRQIQAHYVLKSTHRVGFDVAQYDRNRTLVLDPVLAYSTYLGGNADDAAFGIAADKNGNAYIVGETGSSNFPTAHALQPTLSGGQDAFVAKLNPSGTALVYSTYLGGSLTDFGLAVAVDSSDNAYITGWTMSSDFPVVNAFQPNLAGNFDAFVAKLNSAGSALIYSTYLGGSSDDSAYGVAVDSTGNAYVAGATRSTNFPTMNPLQAANAGGNDVFVTKINPSGSALVYSTYLGGSLDDQASGIALDSSGDAYVTGEIKSTDFPTMNPLQSTFGGGGTDGFVAEFNPTGSALVYST